MLQERRPVPQAEAAVQTGGPPRRPAVSPNLAAAIARVGLVAGLALLWQGMVAVGRVDRVLFSSPADIGLVIGDWLQTGYIWPHVYSTVQVVVAGFLIGVTAGVVGGAVFAFVRPVAEILEPFVSLINGIPRMILAPVLIIVFGLGVASKLAMVVFMVFFLVFFNVYTGLSRIDTWLVTSARVLGAGFGDLLRDVYFPAVVIWIMSSLRVGLGLAFIGAVIGEFMGSSGGLGFVIASAEEQFQPGRLMAALVFLVAVVMVLDWLVRRVEAHFEKWRLS